MDNMNSLREVLDVTNDKEILDIKGTIHKLTSAIKSYQASVKKFIDANYVDFLPNLSGNELYMDEGKRLLLEVETLLDGIENGTKQQLYEACEDLQEHIEELKEITLGFRAAYKVLKIDENFQLLETAKGQNEYLQILDIIEKLRTLIHDPNDQILKGLDAFRAINIKYRIEVEMLRHNLQKRFEQMVEIVEKIFPKMKSIAIKISRDERKLQETITSLFSLKYNPKKFFDTLLENIFMPIITGPASIKTSNGNETGAHPQNYTQLVLSYNVTNEGEETLRPNYKIVFDSLQEAISVLNNMNVTILSSDNRKLFRIFGEQIKERFLTLLTDECLLHSIPETMNEMEGSKISEDIRNFHQYLCDVEILEEGKDNQLLEYAEKIGLLFRNRFCVNILDTAIQIMRKDLHDMSLVSENNTGAVCSKDPYQFPRCMVSRNTLEMISLMEKVLKQADNTTDEDLAKRLRSAIAIILNRYTIEVPACHGKLLESIPQQTALFHNNCMFLAFWTLRNAENGIELFATLVKTLQALGSKYFLQQISNQREQLIEILKDFDLTDSVSELGINSQKSIRQCLRQLDLLKNVWQTILPEIVYNQTMSTLLDRFVTEILRKILAMEDISSAAAADLSELCGNVIERAPTLFQDSKQVTDSVHSWMKLVQLKMILNASLAEITEQWSDEKGPLSMNYKPEEIKHLIRALFQNTVRRANALASIG